MNTDIEAKIDEVLDQKIQDSEMFTAYDISFELQRNHNVKERHNNMKLYTHDVMTEKLNSYYPYKKTLVDVGRGQAFLYHPDSADTSLYSPISVGSKPSSKSLGNSKSASSSSSTNVATASQPNIITPNSRDRLIIPVRSLQSIGLAPKSVAVAYVDTDEELIIIANKSATVESQWKEINRYIVDKSGNIMISENVIKKAGITTDESFVVDVKSDSIELTVYS